MPDPSSVGSVAATLDERVKFIPDFTARATTNVIFARIPRALYTAARHATLLQRDAELTGGGDEYALPPGGNPLVGGEGGAGDESWLGLFRDEAPPYETSATSRTRLLERRASRSEE